LVRGGAAVTIASVEPGSLVCTMSRGVKIVADMAVDDCEGTDWTMVTSPPTLPPPYPRRSPILIPGRSSGRHARGRAAPRQPEPHAYSKAARGRRTTLGGDLRRAGRGISCSRPPRRRGRPTAESDGLPCTSGYGSASQLRRGARCRKQGRRERQGEVPGPTDMPNGPDERTRALHTRLEGQAVGTLNALVD